VQSRRVARELIKFIIILRFLLLLLDMLVVPLGGIQRLDSSRNKRGQPPMHFGRNYTRTAYAKPTSLKVFLKAFYSSRKKPDVFLYLYKSYHDISSFVKIATF